MSYRSLHLKAMVGAKAKHGWAGDFFNCVSLLVSREWHRLLIEPSRIIGIVAQPLLFLIVFGAGFNDSFSVAGADLRYVQFFFPGVLGLVVLFSSIYATLTLVDDKSNGFFRLVLISPGGVLGAVVGKVVATATLSLAQSFLFLPLIFFIRPEVAWRSLMLAAVLLVIGSWCFSVVGVLFAWLSPSASAFHAVMSVILIPMWLLSGAMFPVEDGLLKALSHFNPMAYLVEGLRIILLNDMSSGVIDQFLSMVFFLLIAGWLLLIAVKKRPIE